MKFKYFVYNTSDSRIHVSRNEMPPEKLIEVQKYSGKKAQLEAIFRTTGQKLPPDLTSLEVDAYITNQFYGKPVWGTYLKNRKAVFKETEERTTCYSLFKTIEFPLSKDKDPDAPEVLRKIHKIVKETVN